VLLDAHILLFDERVLLPAACARRSTGRVRLPIGCIGPGRLS
jgi:hypothetical protein